MTASFWALVPALAAIILALVTKEVYFSLFCGILAGALFLSGFHILPALETIISILSDKIGGNINILIFLIVLGMIVALLQRSGSAKAYGEWAGNKISSKRGALGLSAGLGILIFVDDYFNCLTVGTVMKPITDKFKISRAKLAYIIDATAAPICIIAPISSWAAAVSSSLPEGSSIDGFNLFLKTIPFNFYALLTIIMIVFLIATNLDFCKMRKAEQELEDKTRADEEQQTELLVNTRGRVIDLIAPVIILIIFCMYFMLFTGGIHHGASIIDAFANCDASLSLVFGSAFTLAFIALLYLPRKIISFSDFNACLTEGFKAMVPAILILCFAWTLSGISGEGYLDAGAYVSQLIETHQMSFGLVPFIFYLVALGLSFATGTSWGTFAILIPIIATIFGGVETQLFVLSVAACLAGAVNGDHISPISDTTILSSAGAGCKHLDHVATQIPYSLLVTIPSLIGFGVAGFTENGYLGFAVATGILIVSLILIRIKVKNIQPTQDTHKMPA